MPRSFVYGTLAITIMAWFATLTWAVDVPPPKSLAGRLVIDLDEPFETFACGGGGRYYVFHLKQANKLVLLDISAAAIVKSIDAPAGDVLLTAGLDKLIVATPSQSLLHRYDLATLKREKIVPLTGPAPIRLLLGSASPGPLVSWSQKGPISLLDLESFQPIAVKGELLSGDPMYNFQLIASADGQTICGWTGGISGQHFHVLRLAGNTATQQRTPEDYSDNGRWLRPSYDGSLLFLNGLGIYPPSMQVVYPEHLRGDVLLPAEDPRFFLAIGSYQGDNNAQAWICTVGGLEKLVSVTDIGHVRSGSLGADYAHIRMQPRVRYIPSAGVLVSIPDGQKSVVLSPANLLQLMKARGGEYLHVISNPPRVAWLGAPYPYQLQALASGGAAVSYKVESGPEGFTVSPDGKVSWTPKKRPAGGVEKIVIVAGDKSGREAFHAWEVSVERPAGVVVANAKPAPPGSDLPPSSPSPSPTALPNPPTLPSPPPTSPGPPVATQATDEPVKIDDHRLEIPKQPYVLAPGLDQKSTLLLQGDRLTILGADGVTPAKSIKLPQAYERIGERAGYWVGVTKSPAAVELIDKQQLTASKSVKFSAMDIQDLALHPRLPVSYVAFKAGVSVPRFKFIVFQETKGEARESDDYIGTFLAVDPAGKFLISGYRDIYERGANLIFNPGRIHVVPNYGSIDWLLRYDLNQSGLPGSVEVKEEVGGNGRGIRLSPDGRRVSYLSFVGSPPHSGNLTAWDVNDFSKVPTTFPIQGKASTQALAWHPFLPWVACLSKTGGLILDRNSGNELSGKLAAVDFAGAELHSLWFSADGQSLVFDTSINEIHYLHRVALTLSTGERRTVEELFRKLRVGSPAVVGQPKPAAKEKVPLASLHALQGGLGKPMTAKEVAKWFTDAVVVIQTEGGNGSGMIVGSDGYVLTCAHCVGDAEELDVAYRRSAAGKSQPATAKAAVIHVDPARDLALLKIKSPSPLRTVRLASHGDLASGERVVVIGNPAVSDTVLDSTITEGIVSSPSRKLGEQIYVQTSAQVNPGSSGSPLFNENGLVVGQVVLKADLEGAGFATPGDELIEFLVQCADLSGKGMQLRRDWLDATGQRQLDATLQGIAADGVKLKRSDGSDLTIPFTRLSKSDQRLLELLRGRSR